MSDLSNDDVQSIEDLHNRWLGFERRGDTAAVLELCTDDVMWIPPTSPPLIGQQAIIQWLKSAEVKIISLKTSDLRIGGSGTVAYKTSNYSTTYVPRDRSDTTTINGTHAWVLRKLPDAGWKVAVVTWSMFEAPAAVSTP